MDAAKTVLLIDDDDRASTRAVLGRLGLRVIEADSGQEGLRLAQGVRPDLIVLDLMLEDRSTGYSLTQALKHTATYKDLAHVPILMVSSVELSPKELFGWLGDTRWIEPDAYLRKPIDVPVFERRVRELLSGRRPDRVAPASTRDHAARREGG